MDRVRVWLVVSPIVAAGIVVSHVLAYRLTGTPAGPLHGYLEHASQLLFVFALVGLAFGGLEALRPGRRLSLPAAWSFPLAALATFVVQEHVERLVHTGELPWLLASPAFLVGLLLQLPVALLAWALARRLLRAFDELRSLPPRLPQILVALVPAPARPVPARACARPRGRAPPRHHTS